MRRCSVHHLHSEHKVFALKRAEGVGRQRFHRIYRVVQQVARRVCAPGKAALARHRVRVANEALVAYNVGGVCHVVGQRLCRASGGPRCCCQKAVPNTVRW